MDGYRSIEELKSRYYCCQQLLLKARCVAEGGREEDVMKHPVFEFPYDGEHDRIRKQQMELLLSRTEEQEKEINLKISETRKLDAKIRRVRKQLEALKRNPRVALGMIQRAQRAKENKGAPLTRRRHVKEEKALPFNKDGPKADIPSLCRPKAMFPALEPGVHLSSVFPCVAPQLRGRVYKQLESELLELGFHYSNPRPFKVPTKKVCEAYDKLREDLTTLINLNKHLQEREKDRDRLRSSLRAQNKSASVSAANTTSPRVKREAPSSSSSSSGQSGGAAGSAAKRQRKA
eukprot:CAMPEP_0167783230 /NCGR_PEP_ID=MMETSP0111_2-20121227/6954_1 /TAXON_ID=91324 /ORGANISM="Lotharella globosa, Strain CCCM811" /LENGTH=289 /DNA_ID=CAMNT_0007674143 /DNA_START=1 /DNA_END=870 /DNA_ORIENTATION=+